MISNKNKKYIQLNINSIIYEKNHPKIKKKKSSRRAQESLIYSHTELETIPLMIEF